MDTSPQPIPPDFERAFSDRVKEASLETGVSDEELAIVEKAFLAAAASHRRGPEKLIPSFNKWLEDADRRCGNLMDRVPSQYRERLDFVRLRNPDALRRVLDSLDFRAHPSDGKLVMRSPEIATGWALFGATGSGKTRCAYTLLRRLHILGDVDFEAVRTTEFANMVRRCSFENRAELDAYTRRLAETPILLLDDLHQPKFTPSYAEALLDLVEVRTSNDLPMIVTCQIDGKELIEKWSGDTPAQRPTAEAIVRRLRDFCLPFDFDPEQPTAVEV